AEQVDCLEGAGRFETVISPPSTPGGIKMVALPLDAHRALVIEARAKEGLDAALCAEGVLIYEVNSAISSGTGPVTIHGSRMSTSGLAFDECGPGADATWGTEPDFLEFQLESPN